MSDQVIEVIKETGVEKSTADMLQASFLPFFNQAKEWKEKAKNLVVTDICQVDEMKQAREARLALRTIRVEADKKRKELKEDSLRYGRAIQGVYNVIEYLIKPIEEHLDKQEKFIQIQEAEQKARLANVRETELTPYGEFVPVNLDLGGMSEEDYHKVLSGARIQFEAKIKQEAEERAERVAKEKEEREERERMAIENEKLRKEAAERENAMRKEREKAEAALSKEREALIKARQEAEEILKAERAEIERVLREQEEKERIERERIASEKAEREEAERKEKAAPDKAKITRYLSSIEAIDLPDVNTEQAKEIIEGISNRLSELGAYVTLQARKL